MAVFMRDRLRMNRVAVFRNIKEDYSKGLADFFNRAFISLGGTIVTDLSYGTGDTDFRAQLTAIKAIHPQAVFIPGYYNEVALIANQAREIGLTVPLTGGGGWDDPSLESEAGPAMEGCYFGNHYSVTSRSPRSRAFVNAFHKKYNHDPNALSACGYDAMKLLADAMKRAHSLNGDDLKTAIAQTRNFPGVTGAITIDSHHNAVEPIVIIEFKGGKQVQVDTIEPEKS